MLHRIFRFVAISIKKLLYTQTKLHAWLVFEGHFVVEPDRVASERTVAALQAKILLL